MGFSGAEDRWRDGLVGLRNVVRQEVVSRQLDAHLPGERATVLDAGCGQGTQALRLAERGHDVTGVDASRDLLDLLPPGRIRAVHADLAELSSLFEPASFDVVLCHGVLMYFDDPGSLLTDLARLVRPGGLLSLLVRNGDALAMRPGLAGDWRAAREAFTADGYTNRLGVRARADRRADLTAAMSARGLEVVQWYGVRVFTDTCPDLAGPPGDLDALLECEEVAGRTDPYRGVAALTHLIGGRQEA
ncbi:class I SAM-dependent methyltransferase [Nonomuraea sp. NPDC059194]|uniref:class I SAM-dependent methyltransferase n=1 Tax=Nonomuraea sp. NPDC059194 TaxID=3346764 RepID=UPI0036A4C6FE